MWISPAPSANGTKWRTTCMAATMLTGVFDVVLDANGSLPAREGDRLIKRGGVVTDLAASGGLAIPIAQTVSLAQAPALFASLEAGNRFDGKAVIAF